MKKESKLVLRFASRLELLEFVEEHFPDGQAYHGTFSDAEFAGRGVPDETFVVRRNGSQPRALEATNYRIGDTS